MCEALCNCAATEPPGDCPFATVLRSACSPLSTPGLPWHHLRTLAMYGRCISMLCSSSSTSRVISTKWPDASRLALTAPQSQTVRRSQFALREALAPDGTSNARVPIVLRAKGDPCLPGRWRSRLTGWRKSCTMLVRTQAGIRGATAHECGRQAISNARAESMDRDHWTATWNPVWWAGPIRPIRWRTLPQHEDARDISRIDELVRVCGRWSRI